MRGGTSRPPVTDLTPLPAVLYSPDGNTVRPAEGILSYATRAAAPLPTRAAALRAVRWAR
jgi:hypothetical protein